MLTAFCLIVLGTLSRLAPHPPNAVAMGALAIYAGARLPRRWALLVPLIAMAASDVWLDGGSLAGFLALPRVASYATFAAIVAAGALLRRPGRAIAKVGLGIGLSLGASTLFFLTTNLAVWLAPQVGYETYAKTLAGLMHCYAQALPFFRNTLAADGIGMACLFGLDWAASRLFALRGGTKPVLASEL